jgi:hypothetical protein
MGTYIYAMLKDTSEENINKINDLLEAEGFKSNHYNGVRYGAFVTREQLEEDARFMNEDPEGLKQATHLQRPITVKWLEGLFWNKIGQYCTKLSSSEEPQLREALLVAKFVAKHRSLFNLKECYDYTVKKVREYLSYYDKDAKAKAKFIQNNS